MAELFFVNKTGSSQDLSKSSPSESTVMTSHVQRNRRKAEGRRHNRPWPSFISVFPQSEGPGHEGSSGRTTKVALTIIEGRAGSSPPSDMPGTYPTSNAYDTFHCTIIGTDAGTHALLHRTFFDVARANFLAESFAANPEQHMEGPRQASSRHQAFHTERLQRCVHDRLLMYATLAYSSSILGWTTGRFRHQQPPEFFIGKAIPNLRSCVRHKMHLADNWLLLSLYSLAVTELWNGLPLMWTAHTERVAAMASHMAADSLAASRIHLRELICLVTETGGWHLFDPYVLDSTVLADKYLAIASSQPPMLPLTWDPEPWPEHMPAGRNINELSDPLLGRGLLKKPLGDTLKKVVEDLVGYCQIARNVWSHSDFVAPELEAWLFRRLQAIKYRLLTHYHDHTSLYHGRCTSLAAPVFVCLAIPSRGPLIGAKVLAHSLRTALADTSSSEDRTSQDLRAWYVFVGSFVPEPFKDRTWFSDQLQLQTLGYNSTSEVSRTMEQYLFLPLR